MKNIKYFILTFLLIFTVYLQADDINLYGNLVNGRGGVEKCANVRIKLYVNSRAKALTYTDENGAFSFVFTAIADANTDKPGDFSLDQNYPNPFNDKTALPYSIHSSGSLKLDIYDIRGHKVRSIIQDYHSVGQYASYWDGRNEMDQRCPQGIYFYVLEMKGHTEIRKMSLMNSDFISTPMIVNSVPSLDKPAIEQIVKLVIEDDDIENKTLSYTYASIPGTLNLTDIPIHVYAHLAVTPDSLYVMEGEDAFDTLDIYFEKPFSLSSSDIEVDWEFTPDSTVAIHYKKVNKSSITLNIKEDDETFIQFSKINFDFDQRASIWPNKLRRAYIDIPYSHDIKIENNQGNAQLTLKNSLPTPFALNDKTIQGTATGTSETMLYFDLLDDRNVTMKDSALLIVSQPEDVSFNDYVVDVLEEYHRDGRYPYSWVSGYHGVTQDLYYKGTKIAKANSDSSHSTYCSGVTFEVYFRAIKRLQQDLNLGEDINGMSASNFSDFMSKWYVAQDSRRGPSYALQSYGLGDRINEMKDVKKGDFVQIWRTSGSGHSVIFMNWTTNTAGDTTGMKYWSTQTSTNGVNYNTEYFSGLGGNIDKAHTYYSRGKKPEDFTTF